MKLAANSDLDADLQRANKNNETIENYERFI